MSTIKDIVTYSARENQLYEDVRAIIEEAASPSDNWSVQGSSTGHTQMRPHCGRNSTGHSTRYSSAYQTTTKGSITNLNPSTTAVRMTLPEDNTTILASKYELYLPSSKQLVEEVEEGKREFDRRKQKSQP